MSEVVGVIGGAGHVGLPLSIMFANAGIKTFVYDKNELLLKKIESGVFPFKEEDGDLSLKNALKSGNLHLSSRPDVIEYCSTLISIIGTPVDDHLNPDPDSIRRSLEEIQPFLRDGQLLILRSTVFPGVTRSIEQFLSQSRIKIDVATAPERISEGYAFRELFEIPQIIGTRTPQVFERAKSLFEFVCKECCYATPEEAELVKLFSNSWRYITFAAANELYSIALEANEDFGKIRSLMMHKYPRAESLPVPGFAAGPCLPKDSLQLSTYSSQLLSLNSVAYAINENLPNLIIDHLAKTLNLRDLTIGILGMAFKPQSDDSRFSLSYKLRKLLSFRCKSVLCTDPYVSDQRFNDLDYVLTTSDLIVIAVDHVVYREIDFKQTVYRVWNF